MRRILFIVFCYLLSVLCAGAQEDADFRMEIGGGLGGGYYMGDLNNKMFSGTRPAAGAYWRYLFDHYSSLKVNLTWVGIKGSTEDQDDFYPYDPKSGEVAVSPMKAHFTGTVIDMSCMYEINFFPYGYYQDFYGHKRLTPFLQIGVGMTYGTVGKQAALNIPIGVGVKYRASKRLNVSLDWAMHFSTSDKLDGLEDPLGIKSSGFKNKDHYGVALLSLTYSFSPRCPNCNKAK